MMVKFGTRELELGGKYIDRNLRASNDILDDVDALRQRMADDGYLLLRGLQDRHAVLDARRAVLEEIQRQGCLQPGSALDDALVQPGANHPATMGRKGVTHHPAVRNVLESKAIFDFFHRFLGRQPLTYNYKWLRCVKSPDFTGAHYDVVYMGRGAVASLYTVWTPFGDVPLELGTLALLTGSHNLPSYERLRATYGRMDVDRDRVGGWFSSDPTEMIDKFGGYWQTTDFAAGDVILFGMYTMHASLCNTTPRYRISCDTRFQPADEPVDERWVGENPKAHYAWYSEPEKMVTMEAARAQWGV